MYKIKTLLIHLQLVLSQFLFCACFLLVFVCVVLFSMSNGTLLLNTDQRRVHSNIFQLKTQACQYLVFSRIFCELDQRGQRSGASVETARENGERRLTRVRLVRFTLEVHGYGASVLPNRGKKRLCFAVYRPISNVANQVS